MTRRRQEALELLARAIELLAADRDDWRPHTAWPWPRRVSLRKARELGARKDGKTFYLRQSVIDAALEASAPAHTAPGDDLAAATARAARRAR